VSQFIKLPKICGHYSFERKMLERKKVVEGENIEFDFRDLEWIGLLPLSLLFDWILDYHKSGACVQLRFPDAPAQTDIIIMLSKMGFISALKTLGISILGYIPISSYSRVAAFSPFSSERELLSYEKSLQNTRELNNILGGGSDIDIISSGYLSEILHEAAR